MTSFTIRELKSMARGKSIYSPTMVRQARQYLASKEAKQRIAKGKLMARKRRANNNSMFRNPFAGY